MSVNGNVKTALQYLEDHFDDFKRELVELVLNVAWYNQTSRVSRPLRIGE